MFIPTVIEEDKNGRCSYDPYSRLLKDRIIYLSGEVSQESADAICAQLLFLDSQSDKDIKLYIHSPGGSITAGMAIYDVMHLISADVSTIGIGLCASMGAFLLSSGTPGKRFATSNCEVMIHQPLIAGGGINGQATDIMIEANHMNRIKERMTKIMAENADIEPEKMTELTERNNWLTAEEAKAIGNKGLIDDIL